MSDVSLSLEARVERIEDELGIESDGSDDESDTRNDGAWVMVGNGGGDVVAFDAVSLVVETHDGGWFMAYANEYNIDLGVQPWESSPSEPREYGWSGSQLWRYDGGDE